MSLFADHAANILSAAESAAGRGEACSEMTIMIRQDGGIHMIADSDWPIDSLALHHGAKMIYRVNERAGSVRVEGREGNRTCLLQSPDPSRTARFLLAAR